MSSDIELQVKSLEREVQYWKTQAALSKEEFELIETQLKRVGPVGTILHLAVKRLVDKQLLSAEIAKAIKDSKGREF